jgi:hypothetical protein
MYGHPAKYRYNAAGMKHRVVHTTVNSNLNVPMGGTVATLLAQYKRAVSLPCLLFLLWIIEGYWDKEDYNRDGGVAYMEIRKSDGPIVKVTHGK